MLRSLACVLGGVLAGCWLASSPARIFHDQTAALPRPTSKDAAVLAALDERCEFHFLKLPLRDVVEYLSLAHRLEVRLDESALEDACFDGDMPVTCTLRGVSLRSGLKLLLADLGLTYVVEDGWLVITTGYEVENKLHARVYPVADLVTTESEFRSPLAPGGKDGTDYDDLRELIVSIIAPTSWDDVGGAGSATGHGQCGALGVTQTDDVHEEIAALFTALRRVRGRQLAAAHSIGRFWPRQTQPGDDAGGDAGELEVRAYRFFQAPPGSTPANPYAPWPVNSVASQAANQNAGETSSGASKADADLAAARLDSWTKVIAKLVPEMIEPASWEPLGQGRIRAELDTIVIRQTPDVQFKVGKLMYQLMMPGFNVAWYPHMPFHCNPAVRLPAPPLGGAWPEEAEPQPRGAEARLAAALAERSDLDLAGRPLDDALAALAEHHKIPIHLDCEARILVEAPRKVRATDAERGLPLKAVLERLLDELDLTCVVRHEALLVTTRREAEQLLVVKVYPAFDLAVRRPGVSSRAPALDFESLIESITTNLAPTTWDEVGGPGGIRAFTNAGALVVLQSAEVHAQIAAYLHALRQVAAAQR